MLIRVLVLSRHNQRQGTAWTNLRNRCYLIQGDHIAYTAWQIRSGHVSNHVTAAWENLRLQSVL